MTGPMHRMARGLALASWLVCPALSAQNYEVVRNFVTAESFPNDKLLPASDGMLYGTTNIGGTFGNGGIFRLSPDGSSHEELHHFRGPDGMEPRCLVEGADGRIYGVAQFGGKYGYGTAFSFEPPDYLVSLHDFTAAEKYPQSLTVATDGQFYGISSQGGVSDSGTLFRLSPSGDFAVLHEFLASEGTNPAWRLVQASDGYLYGVASSGALGYGSVFRFDSTSGALTTIHQFNGADGENPSGIVQASDGTFLGTTCDGGDGGYGTVYRMNSAGAVTTLRAFHFIPDGSCPAFGLTAWSDGAYYGVTKTGGLDPGTLPDTPTFIIPAGVVFRITLDGSFDVMAAFDLVSSGYGLPGAGLVQGSDGALYGSTSLGGDGGGVFRLIPGVSLTFLDWSDAPATLHPSGELLEANDGNFYGTQGRTVWRFPGAPTRVQSFSGDMGGITLGTDGFIYGSTTGSDNSIFRMDLSGDFTVIDTQTNAVAALLEAADGKFYGTAAGDDLDPGNVFRVDSLGNSVVLHVFNGTDGMHPRSRLVQATDGNFYGTTSSGGATGLGTIFRLDVMGALTTLHDFGVGEGSGGPAGLTQAADGNLYGTTSDGGTGGLGSVFRIDLSGTFSTLHSVSPEEGAQPLARLLEADDGYLYGTTSSGRANGGLPPRIGTVFRIDTTGHLTTLHVFLGPDGDTPAGSGLFQASDGNIYGTTYAGGSSNAGVLFRISWTSPPPSISAVDPSSGRAAGGVDVTVSGSHFHDGAVLSLGGAADATAITQEAGTLVGMTPALSPGTLNDVVVTNPDSQTAILPAAFFADFLDVPHGDAFHDYVQTIFRNGITAGCGAGNYCPTSPVRRDQMAVFLLKAEHGAAYAPPGCTGIFGDVPCPSPFADWIEEVAAEGITAGCGGGNYCPTSPVRRDQMAVFLLKAEHGSGYTPPGCTGVFADVPCPSQFANWIEQLAAENITGGCGSGNYCPGNANTRGQMAVFLTKTFGLTLQP